MKIGLKPNKHDYFLGAFIIVFNGFDGQTCRSLVSEDWGSDMQTGFLGMTIKKDGELTVEDSNLIDKDFKTEETTYTSKDVKQKLHEASYSPCDCGTMNLCGIAWKFL